MHFLPGNTFSEVALTAASTEMHRSRTAIWLKGLVIPGHAALLGSFPPSSAWQAPPRSRPRGVSVMREDVLSGRDSHLLASVLTPHHLIFTSPVSLSPVHPQV